MAVENLSYFRFSDTITIKIVSGINPKMTSKPLNKLNKNHIYMYMYLFLLST